MNGLAEINRTQLQERTAPIVDEYFIHCHWNSQRTLVAYVPPDAHTFLDLGCGPNADIVSLLPDMDYTGIDFIPQYISALAHKHAGVGPFDFSRRRFWLAAIESLPFPDESFDVVYSRHTLEHVVDLRRALSEIQRVLKPGGRFIFCVPADPRDTEPAHITRWRAYRWLRAISSIVSVRSFAQHEYFADELYGYGVKEGAVGRSWSDRAYRLLRRLYNLRQYGPIWLLRGP
ncbi:MAG: class I SAM-dependent methyltransferase [Chloroflexi bacterium]|nr:class I SAM-dependent methyltransferase [Chloroflexota bacterium]